MTLGAVPDSVPFVGCVVTVNASDSFSGSVPARTIVVAVSSAVVTDCGVADGPSFTDVTVIDTVAGALVVPLASVTVNVNESGPW